MDPQEFERIWHGPRARPPWSADDDPRFRAIRERPEARDEPCVTALPQLVDLTPVQLYGLHDDPTTSAETRVAIRERVERRVAMHLCDHPNQARELADNLSTAPVEIRDYVFERHPSLVAARDGERERFDYDYDAAIDAIRDPVKRQAARERRDSAGERRFAQLSRTRTALRIVAEHEEARTPKGTIEAAIAAETRVSLVTARRLIDGLIREGKVERVGMKRATLRITELGRHAMSARVLFGARTDQSSN